MSPNDLLSAFNDLMQGINAAVLSASEAWWVLPVIFVMCFVDGFFPVVPSESLLVALASVWGGTMGWLPVVFLALVGAAGAFLGDQVAYSIGKAVGTRRFKWMNRPKVRKAFDLAEHQLEARGAVLIFTARYIPIGRVAVNFTAGATGFSRKRFTFFDAAACLMWGFYSVGIGALAGQWMAHNKLLAIVISVAIAVVLGWVLDRLIHRFLLRFRPQSSVLAEQREMVTRRLGGRTEVIVPRPGEAAASPGPEPTPGVRRVAPAPEPTPGARRVAPEDA
jgi:membrane-associated protein